MRKRLGAERFATGHYARIGPSGSCCAASTATRTRATSCMRSTPHSSRPANFRSAACASPKSGASRASAACPVAGKARFDRHLLHRRAPVRRFRRAAGCPAGRGRSRAIDGAVIGRHRGLERYTLGQRSGLGIGGLRGRGDAPWFVAAKDLARNALVVVQGADHPGAVLHGACTQSMPHWIARQAAPARCLRLHGEGALSPAGCRLPCHASVAGGIDVHVRRAARAARRRASTSSSTTARSASAGPL